MKNEYNTYRKKRESELKKSSRKKSFSIYEFERTPLGKFLMSMIATWLVGATFSLILLYGPWDGLRSFIVGSSTTTLNHKYIATLFYSEKTIAENRAKNDIIELTSRTDTSAIDITSPNFATSGKPRKNVVKVTDISDDGYKAWKMEISDPAKVKIGISKYFGTKGQKMPYLLQNYPEAIGGVNAGGFSDNKGWGNGGEPVGLCIADGEIVHWPEQYSHNIIGFNEDNVLILGNFFPSEIEGLRLRDAVEFTPFLIINGEKAKMKGDGGWGTGPRTAIGQRKDGTVVFVVVDGRQPGYSMGVTMKKLQEIMVEEDCYNAANLDGGSSTVMSYKNKIVNSPSGSDDDGMRFIPNAFVIEK